MTLDIIVGFGGLFLVGVVGMIVWWLLGRAEKAERDKKAQSPRP
jgi:cbb3-type cytochrome oxidase subunit 3